MPPMSMPTRSVRDAVRLGQCRPPHSGVERRAGARKIPGRANRLNRVAGEPAWNPCGDWRVSKHRVATVRFGRRPSHARPRPIAARDRREARRSARNEICQTVGPRGMSMLRRLNVRDRRRIASGLAVALVLGVTMAACQRRARSNSASSFRRRGVQPPSTAGSCCCCRRTRKANRGSTCASRASRSAPTRTPSRPSSCLASTWTASRRIRRRLSTTARSDSLPRASRSCHLATTPFKQS